MVTVAQLVVVGSVVVAVLVLAWADGFHRGWRKARRAELERVRARQRRMGQFAANGRTRRSTRL